mgnify:CR=1 FL=1
MQSINRRRVGFPEDITITFADGAGAVVLAASDEPGFLGGAIEADGSYYDALGIFTGGTARPATLPYRLGKKVRKHKGLTAAAVAVMLAFAFVVGYATIAWLLRWVTTRSYLPFVVYRIGLGSAVLIGLGVLAALALVALILASSGHALNDPTRPLRTIETPADQAEAWQLSTTLVAAGRRVADQTPAPGTNI